LHLVDHFIKLALAGRLPVWLMNCHFIKLALAGRLPVRLMNCHFPFLVIYFRQVLSLVWCCLYFISFCRVIMAHTMLGMDWNKCLLYTRGITYQTCFIYRAEWIKFKRFL